MANTVTIQQYQRQRVKAKTEPTNADHALYAEEALRVYMARTGLDATNIDEMELGVQDLLSDLRHLCDGLDISPATDVARRHYQAEITVDGVKLKPAEYEKVRASIEWPSARRQ